MGIARLLIIAAAIGFSVNWWKTREAKALVNQAPSPHGFVSAAMPDGVKANTVVILAPENCPSAAAQRADALSERLNRLGIPNVRSASYSVSHADPSAEQKADLDRAVKILNGEIPAVFVNGMAKANPSAEEVAAEYARTK